MNELQLRLEVQNAVQAYIEQLLFQNGVPAYMLEDALNKGLAYVREKAMIEYINTVRANELKTESSEEVVEDGGNESR